MIVLTLNDRMIEIERSESGTDELFRFFPCIVYVGEKGVSDSPVILLIRGKVEQTPVGITMWFMWTAPDRILVEGIL